LLRLHSAGAHVYARITHTLMDLVANAEQPLLCARTLESRGNR
jgi:hypothetical protein